jgi:hypothetical protein
MILDYIVNLIYDVIKFHSIFYHLSNEWVILLLMAYFFGGRPNFFFLSFIVGIA